MCNGTLLAYDGAIEIGAIKVTTGILCRVLVQRLQLPPRADGLGGLS
jgi:hypothetical protein